MVAAFLALASIPSASAGAAPSARTLDGVTLRLVAEAPAPDGRLRAALLVDLAPGWKTYWLDPGDAGLPPRVDAAASTNLVVLDMGFPMPHRFRDAAGSSNGYDQPLAVALDLRRVDPARPAAIDLKLTLGICRDVCIPVATRLRLDVGPGHPADARLVAYAFAALPEPSTAEKGIQAARLSPDGKAILVEALVPDGRELRTADLFLAGPEGWFFGIPGAPRREGRKLSFAVPVTERPKAAGAAPPAAIDAVLDLGVTAYRVEKLPVRTAP